MLTDEIYWTAKRKQKIYILTATKECILVLSYQYINVVFWAQGCC